MLLLTEVMRQQDDIMHRAMQEKVRALAQHLDVPLQDFDTIAEVRVEPLLLYSVRVRVHPLFMQCTSA